MSEWSRRQFLAAAAGGAVAATWRTRAAIGGNAAATAPTTGRAPIDRRAVVARHDVVLRALDPATPLHVGNGDFAFGLDATGLQTFAEPYRAGVPLHTMATWAWHAEPMPDGLDATTQPARLYDVPGRAPAPYDDLLSDAAVTQPTTTTAPATTQLAPALPAATYARGNPHRAALGRVALVDANGSAFRVGAIAAVEQTLELWTGLVRSRFTLDGTPVEVTTAAHPTRAIVAFRIRSTALARGGLGVRIAFPAQRVDASDPDDWTRPDAHRTTLTGTPGLAGFAREQDAFRYGVRCAWSTPDATRLSADGPHAFTWRTQADWIELTVEFAPAAPADPPPAAADVFSASSQAWERFWLDGAAIDFGDCADPRAAELERRVVRSQYLTAVHCAGATPAPETGLACNAQFGKLRLDTAWWTMSHFAMWGRPELLERSMRFFDRATPLARAQAQRQGYDGARWPSLCGPLGEATPGEAGPFVVWQQPHPIYFAEQLYRAKPTRETLDRYAGLVDETARFMASFPTKVRDALSLGPPIVPAQDRYTADRATARDPTFELAYWAWGLSVAQKWRERMGQPRDARWDDVIRRLAKPLVRDGRYAAIATPPFLVNAGHPSFLMALGMLPKTWLIDEATMRETARWTSAQWRWETAWGADFPVLAQTAARLGDAPLAVDALLRDAPTNQYLANGQHAPEAGLPVLLSANGALLAAVAMLAGGWDGGPSTAFPNDGRWTVRCEGFERVI